MSDTRSDTELPSLRDALDTLITDTRRAVRSATRTLVQTGFVATLGDQTVQVRVEIEWGET